MHHPTPRSHGLAAALALLASSPAWSADPPKTDGLWRGTGGAALAVTSGNSDSTAFNLSADMARLTTADKISLGGNYNYGRSKAGNVNTTTADRWNGFGQYDLNLSPRTYAFGRLGFEGDKLTQLSLRSTVGAGLGYKLIDTDSTSFSVFGGLAYSTDRYSRLQTIGGKTSKDFSRTSLLIGEESSHKLSASTSFKQRLEVYPGVTGDKAKIARFTASLGVAMSSTLSLSVGLVNNYNSAPPAGRKSNDVGLFTGINVKLGSL